MERPDVTGLVDADTTLDFLAAEMVVQPSGITLSYIIIVFCYIFHRYIIKFSMTHIVTLLVASVYYRHCPVKGD